MGKLTALAVKNAKPGRHGDGSGLYLLVGPTSAKSWVLRIQVNGTRRDIGLGSISTLTLAEAREEAAKLRKAARMGEDPIAERDRVRKPLPTFRAAGEACHTELSKGWEPKHAAAFLSSLKQHAFTKLGNIRVDQVDASAIRDVLAPIWTAKPAIAKKVRQRIGTVLNYAHSEGWRAAETPSRSVGLGLSKQPRPDNFPALPYAKTPGLMSDLQAQPVTVGRLALMFTILTAARGGETRLTKWSNFDLDAQEWRRPASIMKSRLPHTIPLSQAAIDVIEQVRKLRTTDVDCVVFPGSGNRPLSDMTLTAALHRFEADISVHGFRSSFRDWAAENTSFPDPVAEACLAHSVPDAVVAAYKRTTFLKLRRQLMDAWAEYLAGRSNVVRLVAG